MSADAAKGAELFKKYCLQCHEIAPGINPPLRGPHLFGVFGRKAGTVPYFAYSAGMKNSDLTWDEETLNSYLQKKGFVPGTKIEHGGLKNAKARSNLIAYLKENK